MSEKKKVTTMILTVVVIVISVTVVMAEKELVYMKLDQREWWLRQRDGDGEI